jgi:uncharacterized protein
MSLSTSLACALACALICATPLAAAAAPPAAPDKPPASTTVPKGTSASKTPPGASAPASTPAIKASPSASAPVSGATKGAAPIKGATRKGAASTARNAPAKPKPKLNELQQIDWSALLPEPDRKKYNPNAPAPVHGPLGEGGPPAVQVVTTSVNPDLDQALVQLPGFIVPIGEPRNGMVREFYLVPYIGEDIHVPPPPSNQMVYVRSSAGVATEAVHEAYWVTGKIHVETRTTPLGTSAYSLVASKVEQYQY